MGKEKITIEQNLPMGMQVEPKILNKKNLENFKTVLTDKEIDDCLKVARKEKYHRQLQSFNAGLIPNHPLPIEEIEVDDYEKYRYVNMLYTAKIAQIKEKAYWEIVKNKAEHPVKVLSFDEFYNLSLNKLNEILQLQKPNSKNSNSFVIDKWNRDIFYSLCAYFANDTEALKASKDYKNNPLDPDKGLLIQGPIGCGKTLLMKAFMHNQKQSYKLYSCESMANAFGENGFHVLIEYTEKLRGVKNAFGHTEFGICFDDLGTEDNTKHYGNDRNVMEKMITDRESKLPNNFTHITTNLSGNQIEAMYGPRVWDRMRQMFNLIKYKIDAPSKRHK